MDQDAPHDLRSLFRAMKSFSFESALASQLETRNDCVIPVTLIDDAPLEITCDPMKVSGFIDGIQAAICVTYIEHRPVYLAYASAGAVDENGKLVDTLEKIVLIVSKSEKEWVDSLKTTIACIDLPAFRPDELASAALVQLGDERNNLEKALIAKMFADGHKSLLLDGSILGKTIRRELVGVVKTTKTRYLPDESMLWKLAKGWRSQRFVIPAGSNGCPVDRYSCYVRMQNASQQAWNFGLIRLESFELDLLDPLAALALSEKQHATSRDRRFDKHLAGVRAIEDILRARRPSIYSM